MRYDKLNESIGNMDSQYILLADEIDSKEKLDAYIKQNRKNFSPIYKMLSVAACAVLIFCGITLSLPWFSSNQEVDFLAPTQKEDRNENIVAEDNPMEEDKYDQNESLYYADATASEVENEGVENITQDTTMPMEDDMTDSVSDTVDPPTYSEEKEFLFYGLKIPYSDVYVQNKGKYPEWFEPYRDTMYNTKWMDEIVGENAFAKYQMYVKETYGESIFSYEPLLYNLILYYDIPRETVETYCKEFTQQEINALYTDGDAVNEVFCSDCAVYCNGYLITWGDLAFDDENVYKSMLSSSSPNIIERVYQLCLKAENFFAEDPLCQQANLQLMQWLQNQ